MAWVDYPDENVPKQVVHYMLDLLDRIQYCYLKTDGTYGDLHLCVSDKVKLIEKTLYEKKEADMAKKLENSPKPDTKSDRRNKIVRCLKNAKIARLKAESYDGLECDKPDYNKQAEMWLDAAERVKRGE